MIYFYLNEYFFIERTFQYFHQDIKKEAGNNSGLSFSLKNEIHLIKLELNKIADPLILKKTQADLLRNLLIIFIKYEFLINMPKHLKNFLLNNQIRKIAENYQKNAFFLKEISNLPLFSRIYLETKEILSLARAKLIDTLNLKDNIEIIIEKIFVFINLGENFNVLLKIIGEIEQILIKNIENYFKEYIFQENLEKVLNFLFK